MRKLLAIFIAIFLFHISTPLPLLAKEKDKQEHKTRKERKAEKEQKKEWERVRSRSNDYRFKPGKHIGEHMFKNQTKKEQVRRSKHHLKP